MTIEEILAGESKNVEFKVQRPDKSMKYMKTVVAFANGKGGRIIFGIDDKTREVVGIPDDKVFREIDAITNAISDSCEPTIIPDVYLQNINDKPVIVAEIRTGRRKPYYIKAEGLENGVYIRVSGTTRPADRDMSRELYYECDARSFDSIIRRDIEVTDEDIKSLCEQMKEVAIANCKSNLQRSAVKDVTKNVLLSWGILKKDENEKIVKRMYEEGHLIGNHTYTHCNLSKLETGEAKKELEQTDTVIEKITGKQPVFARAPYGELPVDSEQDLSRIYIGWTVDPLDWMTEDAGAVVKTVVEEINPGDVILLHDCYPSSVQAAIRIVDLLQGKGYEFVTVDHLIMD